MTEGQDTSGLVELTIYGIVTLYEKFEKEAPPEGSALPMGDGAPAPSETPADETPKP